MDTTEHDRIHIANWNYAGFPLVFGLGVFPTLLGVFVWSALAGTINNKAGETDYALILCVGVPLTFCTVLWLYNALTSPVLWIELSDQVAYRLTLSTQVQTWFDVMSVDFEDEVSRVKFVPIGMHRILVIKLRNKRELRAKVTEGQETAIRQLWQRYQSQEVGNFLRAAAEAEPEEQGEIDIIQTCRALVGPPPRSLSIADSGSFRLRLSPELQKELVNQRDKLLTILADQDSLLDRGLVYWGHLVQANSILFNPENRETLPANVIYSTDRFFDGRLSVLSSIARGLFAQKGSTRADRELQAFVDAVTDEYRRVLRQEMPRGYCGGRSVYFATCLIQPQHLPDHYLAGSAFPVVVTPAETEAVMILPSAFWPPELVATWRQ